MKTTYEQRDEREIKFKTVLMPAIAKALDTGKICGNSDAKWCETVKLAGSEKGFFFRYDSHQHRIEISGHYPKSRIVGEHKEFTPRDYCRSEIRSLVLSIGVSADKSAEQIVADMRRRLFPNYDLAFAACEVARHVHEVDLLNVNAQAKLIAAAFGTKVYGRPNGNEPLQNHVKVPDQFGYKPWEVRSDSVEVSLNLSHDGALKLANFLKTL